MNSVVYDPRVICGFGGMRLKIEMNPKETLYVFDRHSFFLFLPLAFFFLFLYFKGLKYCIQSSNLFLDVAHRFHNVLIVRFQISFSRSLSEQIRTIIYVPLNESRGL